MPLDIFSQYIKIRMFDPAKYQAGSFHIVWVSKEKGIKAVIGKNESQAIDVQSYLFDKDIWTTDTAKAWLKTHINHAHSRPELLAKNRVMTSAKAELCVKIPNLSMGTSDIQKLTEELYDNYSKSAINDKYYFYVESVHEGTNLNYDHFSKEEMIKSYRSMSYQPVDWEHYRDQIVGFSLESQLMSIPDQLMSIGFNGIINRLSPYMLIENRDEVVRQRYFEGKLDMSMECYFDEMECMECGFRTPDFMEFEHHVYTTHMSMIQNNTRPARKLIGIDFVGNGIVEFPADPEAEIISLRTDNDGTLKDLIEASFPQYTDKFQTLKKELGSCLAANIIEAQNFAFSTPDDAYLGSLAFASQINLENIEKNSTKNDTSDDIDIEQASNPNSSNLGGTSMFELSTKTAEATNLSEVFAIAQTVLKEYIEKNKLTPESAKAFSTELSEVVSARMSVDTFEVSEIYNMTTEASEKALEEKKAEYETRLTEKEQRLTSLNEEKASLETKVVESESNLAKAEQKVKELEEAESKRVIESKLNDFINTVKASGVALTETMEKTLKSMASACIGDEAALKSIHDDLVAVVKQSNLSEASNVMGQVTIGGDKDETKDLTKQFETIDKKFTKSS